MNIAPGTYRARASGTTVPDHVRWGRAESGNEQIALRFALLDENDNETPDQIWWVGTFADVPNAKGTTATQITLTALRNCGWRGDDLSNLSGVDSDVVEIDCQEEEYKGKTRVKVKWVNKPGAGFAFKQELGTGEIKSLSQKVKGALLNLDRKSPPAAGKPANGARPGGGGGGGGGGFKPASGEDDNIPFATSLPNERGL